MMKFRNFSRKSIFNILIFLSLIYFIFHSIYGDRGIISSFRLNRQLEKTHEELEKLQAERVTLEHTVKLLKSGDADIIDEKARHILGVASPKEQVFIPAVNNTGE